MAMNHIRFLRSIIVTKQASAVVGKHTYAAKAKKDPIRGKAADTPNGSTLSKGLKSNKTPGANILKDRTDPKILPYSAYPNWLCDLIKKRPALSELRRKNVETLVCDNLQRLVKLGNLAQIKKKRSRKAILVPSNDTGLKGGDNLQLVKLGKVPQIKKKRSCKESLVSSNDTGLKGGENLQCLVKLVNLPQIKKKSSRKVILVPFNDRGLNGDDNLQRLVKLGNLTQIKKTTSRKATIVPSNDRGLKGGADPKIMLDSDYPYWLCELIKKRPALSELRRKNIDTLICDHLQRLVQHNNLAGIKENNPLESNLISSISRGSSTEPILSF